MKSQGNFVGPLIFKRQDAPRYEPAFIIVTVTAIVAAILVLVYRFICIWDNQRRDASGTAEAFDHAYEDDFTDKTVSYKILVNERTLTCRRTCNSATSCRIAIQTQFSLITFPHRLSYDVCKLLRLTII